MARFFFGKRSRKGFSLLELVVVVLIIGVIAAVAVPKMFNTASDARDNAAKQTLAILRNAVELYKANNGDSYPGTDEASLKTALTPYLKGPFPTCTAGNKNSNIRVVTGDSNPLASSVGSTAQGWAYNNQTGEVIINHSSYSAY